MFDGHIFDIVVNEEIKAAKGFGESVKNM